MKHCTGCPTGIVANHRPKNILNSAPGILILCLLSVISASASTVVIQPLNESLSKDAKVYEFLPANNFQSNLNTIGSSASPHSFKSLLQFDLSTIAFPASEVGSATLHLYVSAVTTAGELGIHPLLGAWDETTVSWNTFPAIGLLEASRSVTTAGQYYSFDVTGLTKSWLDGSLANHGFAILMHSSSGDLAIHDVDSGGTAAAPYLTVTQVPEPSAFLLTAAGIALLGLRRIRRTRRGAGLMICALLAAPAFQASAVTFETPALDRWMYPFNGEPGSKTNAPIFGAVGSNGFDDRDAQFLLGFQTSSQITAGLGAAQYQINSVRLTLTTINGGVFVYDPTYDSYRSHLSSTDPEYLVDADAGRPIELFGAGFRGSYTQLSFDPNDTSSSGFKENSPFGASGEAGRNVFALGFGNSGATDVSNNVASRFEANPWAIGQTTAAAAGQFVPADAVFTFDLNLSGAGILGYLQDALHHGSLGLIVSSLHPASFGGSQTYPRFYTKENILHDPESGDYFAARLDIDYSVIPEPSSAAMLLAGSAWFACRRRR